MNRDVGETGHCILCSTIPVFSRKKKNWGKTQKKLCQDSHFPGGEWGSRL